jgi:hypothetical protein
MKYIFGMSMAMMIMVVGVVSVRAESSTGQVDIACMQQAVATREASIADAFGVFSQGVTSALTARASALATVWSQQEHTARVTLRKEAWRGYKNTMKSLRTSFKTAKKSAWTTFKSATKSCKGTVEETEKLDGLSI